LAPDRPSVNLAGDYTVTFAADSACTSLPSSARTRSYAATIAPVSYPSHPAGSGFRLTIVDESFLSNYKSLDLFVAGDYFSGWSGDLHGAPGLVEQVGANTYLTSGGVITATVTS